jgi:hypothetical protein
VVTRAEIRIRPFQYTMMTACSGIHSLRSTGTLKKTPYALYPAEVHNRFYDSIWALIADQDLLVDVLPLLFNVVLKVYSYRLAEIIDNPDVRDTIS